MKAAKRPIYLYIGIHLAIPLIALLAKIFSLYAQKTPTTPFSGCWVHDFLFLYCPLCGGTRATGALARFDIAEAFRYNAAVVIFAFLFLIVDIVLLVRLLRKKEKWWSIPLWCWLAVVGLFAGYTVLRNVLMIFWGIDPVGDLAVFWQ